MSEDMNTYDEVARQTVELANRLADQDQDADLWDIADGLLAGAIHYWLYARQPCGDRQCVDCEPMSTAEERLVELMRLTGQLAKDSDYYHSPNDTNVGRA